MFRSKFTWRRSFIVLLLLIAGIPSSAGTILPPSGASGVDLDTFYDNFNDNSLDTLLWARGSFGTNDPLVTVNETGGQLEIVPRANQTGSHYNGVISNRSYNFTGGIIFAEVSEVSQASSQTMLAFGVDNNNKVGMWTENGNLRMALTIGGSTVGAASIIYNSSTHRWWRIRHIQAGDTIRFDTSPDGLTWTQRQSIARGSLNITSGKVNISAGTSTSVATPGRARFDNLSWHPLVPNKGDWSAPTTALTPDPTPGRWDHILWGAASPSTMVKFNGRYFLYYIGAEGDNGAPQYEAVRRSLGVATSSDGIQFTKYAGNPVIRYTTTNGSATQEGVGSATAIVVGNTIHLYYGAIRAIGSGLVDIDIRYRSSTDGFNFTNDTLIYRSAGNEYSPLGVTNVGGIWSVYIKGPLTDGLGALSRLSGTTPTSLPTKTSVTATTFGSGGNANFISNNVFLMHLERRQSTEDRFQVRMINTSSPNALSDPLFTYTFGNFGDHANPVTFKDDATGTWFMYTLNLSVSPAVFSVRRYTPSNVVPPTSTPATTLTRTPTPTRTSISMVTATQTSKSVITATRTPTAIRTVTRTPTAIWTLTRTPTPVVSPTRTPTSAIKSTQVPAVGSAASMLIGDIDARPVSMNGRWGVEIRVAVYSEDQMQVSNATVTGYFGNGNDGIGFCTTDASGTCTIASRFMPPGSPAITFTVMTVSHSELTYSPSGNVDPEGDSTGTIITAVEP